MLNFALLSLIGVYLTVSFLGSLRFKHWIFRASDYPRPQICLMGLFCLPCVFYLNVTAFWQWSLGLAVLIFVSLQLRLVLPYTRLWPKQVMAAKLPSRHTLSALSANVLMSNRNYGRFIDLVKQYDPDLVVALEGDQGWDEALKALHPSYPHRICHPMDNRYGIHLFSRYEFSKLDIDHLFSDEIPSIHGKILVPGIGAVALHCLHPEPPSPTEAEDSLLRDAEILMVAERINDHKLPTLLLGDLNDVAWSRTTRLFLRISGLLDPRIGRGFFNTFPAAVPFFRWSLDHVFHSPDFKLVHIKRLPDIGSDHFPIFTCLSYEPALCQPQSEPTEDQIEEADETVDNANERVEDDR